VREHFKVPISVTSGYRSKKLNKLIGGAKNSEHVEGRAFDLDADVFGGVTNKEIFDFIKTNLEFNQLIWEFGDDNNPDWVHVSYREGENKKRVLRAVKVKGDTLYKVMNKKDMLKTMLQVGGKQICLLTLNWRKMSVLLLLLHF